MRKEVLRVGKSHDGAALLRSLVRHATLNKKQSGNGSGERFRMLHKALHYTRWCGRLFQPRTCTSLQPTAPLGAMSLATSDSRVDTPRGSLHCLRKGASL